MEILGKTINKDQINAFVFNFEAMLRRMFVRKEIDRQSDYLNL